MKCQECGKLLTNEEDCYGHDCEVLTSYRIVFDNGKPFEVVVTSEKELKAELKKFYEQNKQDNIDQQVDSDWYTANVYNKQGEDISESQFISEMISEIIGE